VNPKLQQSTPIFEPREDSDLALPINGDLRGSPRHTCNLDRIQLLWHARISLLRWMAFGFIASVVLALLIPPKYESTTRLMPPENNNDGLTMLATLAGKSGDSGLSEVAGSMLAIKNSGALFVGMLHSRTVQDAVVQRLDLKKVYGVRSAEAARHILDDRTVIWEDRKSGIIETKVRDRSRERAQLLARAYVEELDRAVTTLSTSAARREREFLENRLAGVKKDLDQAARDFSQFASQNTAIDIPAQGKAMVEAAAILQGQLMAAQAEEEGLKQIYTSNNVRVRSLQSRIAELRHQLDQLGKGGTSDDSSASSDSQDSIYPSIRKIPLLGVTYFDLYRRNKIQEALYEALTKRYEMAKVQEAKEIPTVRVLDPADLPERRSTPRRTLIVFAGILLTFVFGCAWILGTAKWAQIDVDDSRKLFVLQAYKDLKQDFVRFRATGTHIFSGKRRNSESGNGRR
jgi:uncharacterized protein involved in exopolysaccharide biosynthesis